MTWEESHYQRWWPPTGTLVQVETQAGETVRGRVFRYTPPIAATPIQLWVHNRLLPVPDIVSVEVLDDGPSEGARGEAGQATPVPLFPDERLAGERAAA